MKNIINSKGVETKIFANTFEYDAFEDGSERFHKIQTICPDCKEVVRYGKTISNKSSDTIRIS